MSEENAPPEVEGWDLVPEHMVKENHFAVYKDEDREKSVVVTEVAVGTGPGSSYNCRLFFSVDKYRYAEPYTSKMARSIDQIPKVVKELGEV